MEPACSLHVSGYIEKKVGLQCEGLVQLGGWLQLQRKVLFLLDKVLQEYIDTKKRFLSFGVSRLKVDRCEGSVAQVWKRTCPTLQDFAYM
jgi:hypothetical protein